MDHDEPTPPELLDQQEDLAHRARAAQEQAGSDAEQHAAQRRAEKAEYLKQRLEEQVEADG